MGDVLSLDLALFVGATFGAALVAGVAGFAFGLVAAAVWSASRPRHCRRPP